MHRMLSDRSVLPNANFLLGLGSSPTHVYYLHDYIMQHVGHLSLDVISNSLAG